MADRSKRQSLPILNAGKRRASAMRYAVLGEIRKNAHNSGKVITSVSSTGCFSLRIALPFMFVHGHQETAPMHDDGAGPQVCPYVIAAVILADDAPTLSAIAG
jgi:hypothetical protein